MIHFKYSKAELAAQKVLVECGLDDPSQEKMSEIIFGRKAFYEERHLSGKEGEIVTFGNRSIITINSNIQFESKKRFAAAHELGHFELHRNLTPIFFDTEYDLINWYQAGPQEKEANEFASEFLMPSEMFYKECYRKIFGPKVIEELSNRFRVSKTAAILKFVERGNHPVAIVYCKDNKMQWWKKSSDLRYFLKFEKGKNPPIGSVAYELFTTKKVYIGDESKQEVCKFDWFEPKYADEQDSYMFEYCLYVKSYNYSLSILWEK